MNSKRCYYAAFFIIFIKTAPMSYSFESSSIYDYKKEINKTLKLSVGISLLISFVLLLATNLLVSVCFGLFFFIVQQIKMSARKKYFIFKLIIPNNDIEILYYEKGERNQSKGILSDYSIKKKMTIISNAPNPYIEIRFENKLLLKQYEYKEWTKEEMDNLIKSITFTSTSILYLESDSIS
jgi:hypothetical protein